MHFNSYLNQIREILEGNLNKGFNWLNFRGWTILLSMFKYQFNTTILGESRNQKLDFGLREKTRIIHGERKIDIPE